MPIIKSAKKKLRKDRNRTIHNQNKEKNIKGLIKNMRRTPSAQFLQQTFSALDKAVKTNLFHKNKVNRIKSRLAKKLATPNQIVTTSKPSKSKK